MIFGETGRVVKQRHVFFKVRVTTHVRFTAFFVCDPQKSGEKNFVK